MNRDTIDSVIRSLRRVNLQGSFLGQTVAIRFGLSESDVEALSVLLDTGAATAGRLSELMGLTSGAVTRVIDRLEQAGYVRRIPDPADRRRVIVELIPEKMAAVQATMAQFSEKTASEMGRYSDAELAVIDDFLTRMAAVTRDEANSLRDTPDREAGAQSEYAAPIGGLTRARLAFRSGANELLVRGSAVIDDLYRATFDGSVPQVRLRDGVVTIQYKGRSQWDWRERRADVSLNADLPWDIEIVGGSNKLQGKFATTDVRSFELTGGVDQLRLTLGRPTGVVPIRLVGGANHARFERPKGAHVQLQMAGGAGSVDFDRQKLRGVARHSVLATSGAAEVPDRFEIEITGGASRITVVEAGD
jgi:DNA-binding MarR family transcriptional regulator